MSITDRCDEIIRLIDEVLGESPSETDVRRRPVPGAGLETAGGGRPRSTVPLRSDFRP